MSLSSLSQPLLSKSDSSPNEVEAQPLQDLQAGTGLGRLSNALSSKVVDGIEAIPHASEALEGAVEPLAALTDAFRIGVAFHQDGNRIGSHTVHASGGTTGGILGSIAGKMVGLPIGGLVGAGIGGVLGGPVGAIVGGEAGSVIGEVVGSLGLGYAGSRIGEDLADQNIPTH